MRSPAEVLKHLSEKSQDKLYRFQRLYRNLYNPEFYYIAYRNIYANGGSMTPGVDGTTIDGLGGRRIGKIIESLKDESYRPHPARREYIEKKNSTKKRPLGIPSGDDKLLRSTLVTKNDRLQAYREPDTARVCAMSCAERIVRSPDQCPWKYVENNTLPESERKREKQHGGKAWMNRR